MPIHLLPDEVASQIAAGEVVERPASVVKELLENALDAQATQVSIHAEQAGRRLIEVSDDGCGIPFEELPLAVTRHATSKLSDADDLFRISTLGFRGEALASVGSVSRLTITSRPAEVEVGGRLRVNGGQVLEMERIGAPAGTSIRVEDLFYNVPARLKFLKSEQTERRYIDTLVGRYALAFPQVRIQLYQNSRPSIMTSGNNQRREVLAAIYGVDIARKMLEVIAAEGELQIFGFISPTSITRSNRREITFFINQRPVQDATLSSALVQAYHTMLMVGRFPLATLFLQLPPDWVDVNVHPTKAEVKFREPEAIFTAVRNAVRRALLAHTPVPELSESPYWRQPGWQEAYSDHRSVWSDLTQNRADRLEPESGATTDQEAAQTELESSQTRIPLLRLVGQVASAFLVAEGPDGLYLIDQHAAHERVLFEKMMAQYQHREGKSHSEATQALLSPVSVELPPASARLLAEQIPVLAEVGFQVEEFGRNTFLVRGVPSLLAGMDPSAALLVLVEDFEEDESPLLKEIESRVIARVCKRAAIKAGQSLSVEEQRALLSDLEGCISPRTCPHGRPTMIHLSVDLLERQFGRRGAR